MKTNKPEFVLEKQPKTLALNADQWMAYLTVQRSHEFEANKDKTQQ